MSEYDQIIKSKYDISSVALMPILLTFGIHVIGGRQSDLWACSRHGIVRHEGVVASS